MLDKTKPMDLGDIFSNTFNLIKETFTRNIIIATAFFVPAGILMAYGFDSFFSGMMEAAKNAAERANGNANPEFILSMFSNLGLYFFAILVFIVGYFGATIGITTITCGAINGERTGLGEAFSKVFSITFWRSIGQSLLLILVVGGCILACVIIIMIGMAINKILGILFTVVVIPATIVLIIYLIFIWYFAFVAIVNEDKGIMESFSRSSFLVKGNWWRTFGIIILTSILVDFAVSIISTPISFIFMWDFISQYFKMIAENMSNQKSPEDVFKMMGSLGFGFGAVLIITTILDALVTPLITIVMYFDLRIRKNEFQPVVQENNLQSGELTIE